MRFFLSVLIFFLFSFKSYSNQSEIPEHLHGTYSLNCSIQNDVFIFSKSGYFSIYKNDDYSYYSLQLTNSVKYNKWIVLDGKKIFAKNVYLNLNENILNLVLEPSDNPDGSYDFLTNVETTTYEYKKCSSGPTEEILLFGEVFSYLNSAASLSCSKYNDDKSICFKDIFDFLDVSENNALSNAEINRASKLLIFFSTINGEEFNEAGIFGTISGYAIAPILTKMIISNFDFDDSRDLTLEEILQDRESLFNLEFDNNNRINFDNQEFNNQLKDFVNKLKSLGNFL